MKCSFCFGKIKKNIYQCGFKHFFHIKCFNKLNTNKCIFCSNYTSIYIENVIPINLCNKLIEQGEIKVFTKIQNNKFKEEYIDESIRNNTACVIKNNEFVNKLSKIIKEIMPDIDNVYDYLRFTKYIIGNKMIKHKDTKFKNIKINNESYRSNYTLIIFLSDVEGGDLRLYNNDNSFYDISPKTGAICILNQDMEHEVLSVTKNIRYGIRTDLLKKNKEKISSSVGLVLGNCLVSSTPSKALILDPNRNID